MQANAAPVALGTPNLYRSLLAEPIRFPALARPTIAELQAKYPGIREIVGEDTSPTGEVVLDLGTVLTADETDIDGATYATRREPLEGLTLGIQHALWIVEKQDELPAWFKALRGQVCIDFPGIVVLNAANSRFFPVIESGSRWHLNWHWAAGHFSDHGRIAVAGHQLDNYFRSS